MTEQDAEAYYAARRRGNLYILVALLAFVALTSGVIAYGFDTDQFRRLTAEHEAEQQRIKALHEAIEARAIREGTAAANGQAISDQDGEPQAGQPAEQSAGQGE